MLIDGLKWCVLLVDYCDVFIMFGLSFWRHPFTAEDPLVSKWCNATFLQICSHEETCSFPVAQMVEHGTSNAKIMGSIPRESKSWSNVKL